MRQVAPSVRTREKSSNGKPKRKAPPARGPVFSPSVERAVAVAARTESAPAVAWSPEEALDLQDALGNRKAGELVTEDVEPRAVEEGEEEEAGMEGEEAVENESEVGVDEDLVLPANGAPPVLTSKFIDLGRVGTARYGDTAAGNAGHAAHAFVNGGQTGTVIWGGGGGAGARGNEAVGSIQFQFPPVYESRSLGLLDDSEAWVAPLTGFLVVFRSWVGINSGNQGNGHFVTPAAAARINQHETLHVASTSRHHATHLQPMLDRARDHWPAPFGGGKKVISFFQFMARILLAFIVGWKPAIDAFAAADTADNTPMGTVDTADLASGTYPVDSGPGTVGGVNFQHRVHLPSEAVPV